jgi:predicted nuclease of restriction endonuclease-like RecB superfamily
MFEESSKRGYALTDFERSEIISSIASTMNLSVDDIENTMWSDFEENMVLDQFTPITSNELLAWYNLALMQTLLFNCTRLDFYVSGGANWKRVLRDVKRLGMMYHLESNGDELSCSIDGPLSLFKMTDKYGTSIAKLLPSIIASGKWRVKAWVVRKTLSGKKMYEFETSNEEVPPLMHPYTEQLDDRRGNAIFDSSIEEKFASKFEQFANGWNIIREPDPIIAAGKALIPDFMFEKYNQRVYLEIVGFWTKEYLERKIQKLIASSKTGENKSMDMLIAVNEELACSKLSSLPKEKVIFYRNEVPIKSVVDYLKKIDQRMIERYSDMKIDIDASKEVIPIQEIAQRHSMPEESALKILSKNSDYIVVGKFLVSRMKAHKMEKLLEGITKFVDACSVLSKHDIPELCHAELISMLGYDVVWKGLDIGKATITKHKNKIKTNS